MFDDGFYLGPANYANPSFTEKVTFRAVKVEKGRKFKGRGFIVSTTYSSGAIGWKHTVHGWTPNTYESETAKIWVPELQKFQYANLKYVEDDTSVSPEECAEEFRKYQDLTIANTISWCKSKQPNATESQNLIFTRRVLLKNHPEMREAIDRVCPDSRDLKTEIENTIVWVNSLKKRHTRPKKIQIARKALNRKGLSNRDGFEECFTILCEIYGWLKKPKN